MIRSMVQIRIIKLIHFLHFDGYSYMTLILHLNSQISASFFFKSPREN